MAVLTDEGRAVRKAYKRAWDENHKQHNKLYQVNYWNRKAKELVEQQRKKVSK